MLEVIAGKLTENKYSSSLEKLDEATLNARLC